MKTKGISSTAGKGLFSRQSETFASIKNIFYDLIRKVQLLYSLDQRNRFAVFETFRRQNSKQTLTMLQKLKCLLAMRSRIKRGIFSE